MVYPSGFFCVSKPRYLGHFFLPVERLTPQCLPMKICSSALLLPLLFILSITANAAGKKTPPASISFHLEGSAAEAPKFAREFNTLAGARYFRKVPEINSKNIQACSPFPADDKRTYGMVFKLNAQGTKRLNEVTTMHRDKLLLSLVNGQPLGIVRIDRPVSDGVLVIWTGITQQEIKLYDQIAPRIGEDPKQWKARLKQIKKDAKKKS
jgi:hypothetical protein